MRYLHFLIVLFFCLPVLCSGQFVEQYSVEGEFDRLELDNLLNVYTIKNAEIKKYRSDGGFSFRFSDNQLGDVGLFDVTYPLRPFVLYPDLNYLILLDNTLSNNRGRINLLDRGIGLGSVGCSSVQNHFWIYDAMNFSLIRMNENFKDVAKTGNLSQILRVELNPVFMVEFNNRVYMNNPATGILVFDIFGTYIKTIPLKGLNNFQVFGDIITYFKDNTIHIYQTKTFQEENLSLPIKCRDAKMMENIVIGLHNKGFTAWQIVDP